MDFNTFTYSVFDRVATVSLNRPKRFNAINGTMPDDLAAAINHAANDDAVHVIVLTGAGKVQSSRCESCSINGGLARGKTNI